MFWFVASTLTLTLSLRARRWDNEKLSPLPTKWGEG